MKKEDKKIYPSQPDAKGYYFENEQDEKDNHQSRKYPTPKDEEGYYYQDKSDELMGIETRDEEGGISKRVTLSNGKKATVRELLAEDDIEIGRIIGKNEALRLPALLSKACLFDGKPMIAEDIQKIKLRDYTKLKMANSGVNF